MSPAAAEAAVLTHLATQLENAADTDIDRMATYWAGLHGHIADEARHLIDEVFEYRQAFRRAMNKGVLL